MTADTLEAAAHSAAPPGATGGPPHDLPHIVIQPTRGWAALQLRDVWPYRELLFFLTWRDISVRYKQTALGVGWIIRVETLGKKYKIGGRADTHDSLAGSLTRSHLLELVATLS